MKVNLLSFLFLLLLLLIGIPQSAQGQYKTRLWNSFNVGAPLTEKLDI